MIGLLFGLLVGLYVGVLVYVLGGLLATGLLVVAAGVGHVSSGASASDSAVCCRVVDCGEIFLFAVSDTVVMRRARLARA